MLNALNYKHGGAGRKNEERLYTIWRGMKQRCENEHNRSYKYYGKRGIGVCDEWSDFSAFREWALNNGYDEKCCINHKGVVATDENGFCHHAERRADNG